MEFSDTLVTVGLGAAAFSALFVLGLVIGGRRAALDVEDPNVELPAVVTALVPVPGAKAVPGPIPWSRDGGPITRESLVCRADSGSTCVGRAYVVRLPVLEDPDAPGAWSTYVNAWWLSTQRDLRTGWPLEYPVATVLIVPRDAPETARFIMDGANRDQPTDTGFDGLKPMIQADNTVLNMGSTWADPFAMPKGRNVTGDWPHSFVVFNASAHEVYFGRDAIDLNTVTEQSYGLNTSYWRLKPGSWTLLWPHNTYWASVAAGRPRRWNAGALPPSLHAEELAAKAAEVTMYDYLAPQAPVAP